MGVTAPTTETELLAAARAGDEPAFEALVAPRRAELHAHLYRMLGSVHDADDALQDTLLRAWRALAGFEARSGLRPWLFRIATNVALTAAGRRAARALPVAHGPEADPAEGLGKPLRGVGVGGAVPDARRARRAARGSASSRSSRCCRSCRPTSARRC